MKCSQQKGIEMELNLSYLNEIKKSNVFYILFYRPNNIYLSSYNAHFSRFLTGNAKTVIRTLCLSFCGT